MDAEDRLRLDYERTNDLARSLMDGRLTMLALVPTVAGAAVAVVGTPRPAAELLAVGLLGLIATAGILLYELRTTEVLRALHGHGERLAGKLGLEGGPDRLLARAAPRRLLAVAPATHEWGLGLIYGAALAGWSYLAGWGALAALGMSGARATGGIIAAFVLVAVTLEVERAAGRRGGRGTGPAEPAYHVPEERVTAG